MPRPDSAPDARDVLHPLRGVWIALLLISGVVNVLALSGALYMLQVYDRVLTSHSVETLIALSVLLAGLTIAMGILEAIRAQMLLRIGTRIDSDLMPLAHRALARLPLMGRSAAEAVQSVRDVDTLRAFYSGLGPVALLDLPWGPVFLVFVWALSPLLGVVTLLGVLILVAIAALGEAMARGREQTATLDLLARIEEIDATCRNAETMAAMGLAPRALERLVRSGARGHRRQRAVGDTMAVLSSLSKIVRLLLQATIIGTGAWLAIRGDLTAGAIVAASVAGVRALQPLDQAIGAWRGFVLARQSHGRLAALGAALPAEGRQLALPPPRHRLVVKGASVVAPGSHRLVLRSVTLEAAAGSAIAVVGHSGAGKSTLARALTGIWPLAGGAVLFDGAPLTRWSSNDRGAFIGYMPQYPEFFPATLAETIARLDPDPDPSAVIAAARLAGIHEAIVSLPQGYETPLSTDGSPLSAGQRQLVALARALYGDPFLIVLDEPNASLDADGETALQRAIMSARERGAIVIVVAHRRSLLKVVDRVAVVENGQLKSVHGAREFVSAHLTPIGGGSAVSRARHPAAAPAKTPGEGAL